MVEFLAFMLLVCLVYIARRLDQFLTIIRLDIRPMLGRFEYRDRMQFLKWREDNPTAENRFFQEEVLEKCQEEELRNTKSVS